MTTIRHSAFVKKAPNTAKFGAFPPREGYINRWEEDIETPRTDQEWADLQAQEQEEEEKAQAEALEYLGYPLRGA